MDEQLLRQLARQLKIINIWIAVFGTLVLVVLAVLAYLVFRVVTFVDAANKKFDTFTSQTKQTLDLRKDICGSNALGGLLQEKTGICKQ